MLITAQAFVGELPRIKQDIENCDFIAIDAEFTGISLPNCESTLYDSLQERYSKMRKIATSFMINQFGFSTFTWDQELSTYKSVYSSFSLKSILILHIPSSS